MQPLFICLNRKGLENILPHRDGALIKIDGIFYDSRMLGSMLGVKHVDEGDRDMDGHFPGAPTYPGYAEDEFICLVAAALLSVENCGLKTNPHVVQKIVRYKKRVVPGDIMVAEVKLRGRKNKFIVFSGEIRNQNGELVAEYERIVGVI